MLHRIPFITKLFPQLVGPAEEATDEVHAAKESASPSTKAAGPTSSNTPIVGDDAFSKAMIAANSGSLREARDLFQESLSDQELPEALYNIALLSKELDDVPAATNAIRRYMALVPNDLDGEMFYLRLILEQPRHLQNREEIIHTLTSCLDHLPDDHMLHCVLDALLSIALADRDNTPLRLQPDELDARLVSIDGAMKTLEDHPMKEAWYQTLLFVKALMLRELERIPEAIATYLDLLQLNPNHIEGVYQLSLLFAQFEDWSQVEELNAKVLEFYPEHHQALNQLGLAKFGLEKVDDAISCFHKAITLAPNEVIYKNNLAYAYERLGDVEKAVILLQEVHDQETDPKLKAELGEDLAAMKAKYQL
jgi:tetratricopeptide (TPR) repeat protein